MNLECVLFDCDGVLVDNEKEAHQIAFNEAFKREGLKAFWDDELYKDLLLIGGGKERLKYYFEKFGWPEDIKNHRAFIEQLHQLKSRIYFEIIKSGKLKSRPGIIELMNELIEQKIPFGICSTSKKESVDAVIKFILGEDIHQNISFILAGDIVPRKKPDPEIYLTAAKQVKVAPQNCLVIEDSEIGMKAGKAAGMKVLITKSYYNQEEKFDGADWILSDLEGKPLKTILNRLNFII